MLKSLLISLSIIASSLVANSSEIITTDSNENNATRNAAQLELIKLSIAEYEDINKNLLMIQKNSLSKSKLESLTEVGYSNCNFGYSGVRNTIDCFNENLKTLSGWENLNRVNKTLNLSHNHISNINNLSGLTYVGGFNISNNLLLDFNLEIPKFEGDLTLDNNILTNITGLNSTVNMLGVISAENNNLEDVSGFKNMVSVNGINLKGNNLSDIKGFNKLKIIFGNLNLSKNKLTDISGFNNLMSIEGDLTAYRNKIEHLSGFGNLTFIKGNVNLIHNKLFDLSGFSSLKTVSGSLNLANNNLSNVKDLSNLNYIGGGLNLSFNNLVNLSGLENLFVVKGDLSLSGLPIDDLSAIKGLSYLDGDLYLNSNQNLEDLTPLNNLVLKNGSTLFLDKKDYLKKISLNSYICSGLKNRTLFLSGSSIDNICGVSE